MMQYLFTAISALMICINASAIEKVQADTIKNKDNRNMMLNAESATVPREINIGLPPGGTGAITYVDGAKQGEGLERIQFHWAGGNAYEPVRSISLMEAVITTGEIGILVDSRTRTGGELHRGDISFGTSSNGLIKLDAAVNGPLAKAKGWYYSAGIYVNLDPTSVHYPNRTFVDQKQIYQFAITKRWKRTELNFLYRISLCNDSVDNFYRVSPFIYNGDGSISPINGFLIGRSCYLPMDESLRYKNLETGKFIDAKMSELDRRHIQDYTVTAKHKTLNDWDLRSTFHFCAMFPSTGLRVNVSGIDDAVSGAGFTRADGSEYIGKIQKRLAMLDYFESYDFDWVLDAEKHFDRHFLRWGCGLMYADQYHNTSTAQFAHTVEANPDRIYKDGANSWSFNTNSQYFKGWKASAAAYLLDEWKVTDKFTSRTGVRIKPIGLSILCAPAKIGEVETGTNKRVDGFYISASPDTCQLYRINHLGIDWSVSEHLSYRFSKQLYAFAEGFYSITNKVTTYYQNQAIPSTKAIGNALASGGVKYNNDWMDLTAMVSFITSWNNANLMTVTKKIGNVSESIPWTAQYGIRTPSCTLDANFHFGGFKLHSLVTFQDPRYKNYNNIFTFSDGSTQEINYTGKLVTGISRFMAELDPSYSWSKYRAWASLRYYSRQYASRTNLAYFQGHVESFAGFDVKFDDHNKLSLNLVNIFFQNGVKGSIDIADTIEDRSELNGYLMAGTYIRPFTAQLKYTYHF